MTPTSEAPAATRPRRRRLRLAAPAALVLAAGLALLAWRLLRPDPLSAEERQLVGTWAFRWDDRGTVRTEEFTLLPDRTVLTWLRDPKTGAATATERRYPATWRAADGVLVVRVPEGAAGEVWHVLPSQRDADYKYHLTPEGPDRFRVQFTLELRGTPVGPPAPGTWTRAAPPGDAGGAAR